MPRDHAPIRLDIWTDDDFTDLTSPAQWLYLRLLSAGGLNYAGVTDWRPGRIAASSAELSANDVEMIAQELEVGEYVVIDRTSEECLIRSFVKHDGFMDKWNMAAAFATAWNVGVLQGHPWRRGARAEATPEGEPGMEDRGERDDVRLVLTKRSITPSTAREMTRTEPHGSTHG